MALVQKKAAEQEGKAVEEKWDTSDIVTYVSEQGWAGYQG